jgi:hypothetical protein
MLIDVKKKRNEQTESRATYEGPHMTHRHKLTRGLRSLGKAETAETEIARYPRAQKIQHFLCNLEFQCL